MPGYFEFLHELPIKKSMERIRGFFKKNTSIIWVGSYIPKNSFTSEDIEGLIKQRSHFTGFSEGVVYEVSGTYSRHFCSEDEQASTLAINASIKAIENAWIEISEIDCIIFASASQDIIEPATANIVQYGLGSSAPVFDVKNACNSFLNGMQLADSLIQSWKYKRILICSWETPSRAIKWSTTNKEEFKNALAWYSLWDWGVAMIVSAYVKNYPTIEFLDFYSRGEYYKASTILWGWSLYPRDIEKNYFISDSRKLSEAFGSVALEFIHNALIKHHWQFSSIDYFLPHIVSRYSLDVLRSTLPIDHHKIINYNGTHGNMASCSIPYALIRAIEERKICKWDRALIIWLWAGASFCAGWIQF
jgi:acyl-CoA:acyl-CoA alkyltransferase